MPDFTFAHRDEGFDDHIDKSIRGYNVLHDDIVELTRYFVEDDTSVIDLGCSTGKTIHAMMQQNHLLAPKAKYIGIEYANGFVDELTAREAAMREEFDDIDNTLEFHIGDIRNYRFENASIITSIFTLQFMPPASRREVIKKIYNGLNHGGAFIFAEKTMAEDPRIQEMMTFTYYDYKRKHFTDKDILDKEQTLRNMLKPMTWKELKQTIATAGFCFSKIQPFWANHLFVGAIAIK